MSVFFSSDHHFNHKNIRQFCPHTRKGETVERMNEMMIQAHNDRVSPKDTVHFIGDFSFGSAEETLAILRQMNGQKHITLGNHDKVIRSDAKIQAQFSSVAEYRSISVDKQRIILCHFPMARWDAMHYGAFHFHGHTHGDYKGEGKIMDVGIDTRPAGDMAPWSWEELRDIMNKCESFSHHKGR